MEFGADACCDWPWLELLKDPIAAGRVEMRDHLSFIHRCVTVTFYARVGNRPQLRSPLRVGEHIELGGTSGGFLSHHT